MCYRNNAGLEPELTQLRFGMWLIWREGRWQGLVGLDLLLEADLIYSSIHLLHSIFPALVGRSPASRGTSFRTNGLGKSQEFGVHWMD